MTEMWVIIKDSFSLFAIYIYTLTFLFDEVEWRYFWEMIDSEEWLDSNVIESQVLHRETRGRWSLRREMLWQFARYIISYLERDELAFWLNQIQSSDEWQYIHSYPFQEYLWISLMWE